MGNGTVINIPGLFEELAQLDKNGVDYKGRLKLSSRAHLVSSIQILADNNQEAAREKESKV
jgi:adenylosuccinate synthase